MLGVACTLLLLCGATSSSRAAEYAGANVQTMTSGQIVPVTQWDSYLGQLDAQSLNVARTDAWWAAAEPNPPADGKHTYTWNPLDRPYQSLDRMATYLARHHIRMSAGIGLPPTWAREIGGSPLTPEHYGDFAAFAGAYAARYGSKGSFWAQHPEVPRLPVHDYEVWTEANSGLAWTGGSDPVDYVSVLRLVSAAVHAADPSGRVLASIGWHNAENYVRNMYSVGVKGVIDGVAFHPYSPTGPSIAGLVVSLRAVLRTAGDGGLPIQVTEIGQPADISGNPGKDHAYEGAVTDPARAATQSYAAEVLARSNCGVGNYLFYQLLSPVRSSMGGVPGYIGSFSIETGRPNATGLALAAMQQRLNSSPSSRLALCGGTTARQDLLPLQASFNHSSPRCISVQTNFYGNPFEGAALVLSNPIGEFSRTGTDAHGNSAICIPDDFVTPDFDAVVQVPNEASSQTVHCSITTTECTTSPVTDDSPPPPPPTPSTSEPTGATGATGATGPKGTKGPKGGATGSKGSAGSKASDQPEGSGPSAGSPSGSAAYTTASGCVTRIKLTITAVRPRRTRARGLLQVCPVVAKRYRVRLYVQHGKARRKYVRTLKLLNARTRTFVYKHRLVQGDHLILLRRKSTYIKRIQAKATVTRKFRTAVR